MNLYTRKLTAITMAEELEDVSKSFATSRTGPAAAAIAAVKLPFMLVAIPCPVCPPIIPTLTTDSSNSFLTLKY